MVLGEFATSAALSGRKVNLLGNIIVTQVGSLKWAFAAVAGVVLTVLDGRGGCRPSPGRRSQEGALIRTQAGINRPWRLHSALPRLPLRPLWFWRILSFQTGPEGGPQFPIIEWSAYWYAAFFGLTPPSRIAPLPIDEALFRSMTLAVMTMVVSTVLGVRRPRLSAANSGLRRRLLPDRARHDGTRRARRPRHGAGGQHSGSIATGGARSSCCTWSIPFRSRSSSCWQSSTGSTRRRGSRVVVGVPPARTFRKITFPLIFPGVLSAMLFAFTLSYDEFSRTCLPPAATKRCRWRSMERSRSRIIPNISPSACSPRCSLCAAGRLCDLDVDLGARAKRVLSRRSCDGAAQLAIVTGAGSSSARPSPSSLRR